MDERPRPVLETPLGAATPFQVKISVTHAEAMYAMNRFRIGVAETEDNARLTSPLKAVRWLEDMIITLEEYDTAGPSDGPWGTFEIAGFQKSAVRALIRDFLDEEICTELRSGKNIL